MGIELTMTFVLDSAFGEATPNQTGLQYSSVFVLFQDPSSGTLLLYNYRTYFTSQIRG